MMRRLIASVVSLVFVFAAGATTTLAAQAGVRNHLDDKFQVSAAMSWVTFTTKIRVDSDEGQGTEVDVEDDLGASRTVAAPRLGFRWGISKRHSLEFEYLFARRGGERQITRSFEYQGETYDAGLFVKTKFNSDLAGLTWRWAFHASEKSRIGATLGLGAILLPERSRRLRQLQRPDLPHGLHHARPHRAGGRAGRVRPVAAGRGMVSRA